MKKNELQFDCELKANNLKTALESVIVNDFQSGFLLENLIQCQTESIESTKKLLESLMVPEEEGA